MSTRFHVAREVLLERFGPPSALCVHARAITHSDSRHDMYDTASVTAGDGLRLSQFMLKWNLLHTRSCLIAFRTSAATPCSPDTFLEPIGLMSEFGDVLNVPSSWWPYSGELLLAVQFRNRVKYWTWNYMAHFTGERQAIGMFAGKFGEAVEAAVTRLPTETEANRKDQL